MAPFAILDGCVSGFISSAAFLFYSFPYYYITYTSYYHTVSVSLPQLTVAFTTLLKYCIVMNHNTIIIIDTIDQFAQLWLSKAA